ncbi:CFI-box-CTERM domain-containing protein [Acidobacteriota bacterium]
MKGTGKIFAIVFLLNFAFSPTLHAQWAKTYGTGEDEHAYFIEKTNDGGYIVAGKSGEYLFENNQSVPPGQDIWIIKLSSSGDIEWQKIFGDDSTDEVHFIQQTNDRGYIFGGRLIVEGGLGPFTLIKLSPTGDIEWQKNYGGDSWALEAYSLQKTVDGGFIVAANSTISNNQSNILILKLFNDGSVEWSKTYGGNRDDLPLSIQQTIDGGYIVAGRTNSFGAGDFDIWILKLASDGSNEWQKTYGGSDSDIAHSIQQTSDGGYIIAGLTRSFGAGQVDFWILKISLNGNIEWNNTYGGSLNENASCIQPTNDGGYIVVGTTTSFGAGFKDILILKLGTLGDIEWQKTYGGIQNEEGSCILQSVDGGYIVAGSSDGYGEGKRDFFIFKLFSNGDINSSCIFISDSNAEVFNVDISPTNTSAAPDLPNILSVDLNTLPRESEAVVYRLCLGLRTLNIGTSSGGTTVPDPGTYVYDHAERIRVGSFPENGYAFVGWSGDAVSTADLLSIAMDSDKSVKANYKENILDDVWEEVKKAPCFIATATFGSPFHPYVIALQDFRDKYLMSSRAGRKLVNLYYKYSPHIAKLITNHKALRTVVHIWLVPFVAVGYSMVHFGPIKTSLMFVFSIMPLFLFIRFYRRKDKRDML